MDYKKGISSDDGPQRLTTAVEPRLPAAGQLPQPSWRLLRAQVRPTLTPSAPVGRGPSSLGPTSLTGLRALSLRPRPIATICPMVDRVQLPGPAYLRTPAARALDALRASRPFRPEALPPHPAAPCLGAPGLIRQRQGTRPPGPTPGATNPLVCTALSHMHGYPPTATRGTSLRPRAAQEGLPGVAPHHSCKMEAHYMGMCFEHFPRSLPARPPPRP